MEDQALLKIIKDKDSDIKSALNEYLAGCDTPEKIINKWNEFIRNVGGADQFSWIEHNDKRVLFADISNSNINWGLRTAYTGICFLTKLYHSFPKSSTLLIIFNMEKISFNKEAASIAPEFKEIAKNQFSTYKSAIFGMNAMQRIVLNIFSDSSTKLVKTKEEALDFVTS